MFRYRNTSWCPVRECHKKIPNRNQNIIKLNEKSAKKEDKSRKHFNPSSFGLLIIPITSFGLGVWQTKRLKWKEDLIVHLKEQVHQTPVPFPVDLNEIKNLEYRRVRIRGQFLYDKQFIIAPRGRFDEGFKDMGQGLIGNSQSSSHGGHFITPFKVDGTHQIIMVNRGWLPTEKFGSEKAKRRKNEIVEIDAIVRKTEKRPQFVSKNQPSRNVWFYKDLDEMGAHCGSLPILVDIVYDPRKVNEPIGGQTNINLRNDHLSYLITWYSLSGITALMWYFKFMR